MRKSDGTLVDVQLESSAFPYQTWRPEQYRTVIIDITERKQMEKARQLGIAAYMMKPVSMLKIAKTIQKLMDQKNAKSLYKRV
jgi:response regulator of citrate/malate metabolism